jgi:hypothetical protein
MIGHFDRENLVVHQDDDNRFDADSEDVHIIRVLSGEPHKPCWITADLSQKRDPAERAALRDSGMTIFFFKKNNGTPHFQALKVLSVWPKITELAATARVPTAFEVPFGKIGKLNEKIDRICPTAELFRS